MEKKYNACVVVGRSLTDLLLCGGKVLPGFEVHDCKTCGKKTVISPDGAAQLKAHVEKDGILPENRVVLCNPCGLLLMAFQNNDNQDTVITKHAMEQADVSESAKRNLDLMLKFAKL